MLFNMGEFHFHFPIEISLLIQNKPQFYFLQTQVYIRVVTSIPQNERGFQSPKRKEERVTTAPAPMKAKSPKDVPQITVAFAPTVTPFPTFVGA
jgi:hypothetical protein